MSRMMTRSAKKAFIENVVHAQPHQPRFKPRFPEARYPADLYTAERPFLAYINKQVFDDIKRRAPNDEYVLAKMKNYLALSHKDKVAAAQTVSDLRVSYFHFNSAAFASYLISIQLYLDQCGVARTMMEVNEIESDADCEEN